MLKYTIISHTHEKWCGMSRTCQTCLTGPKQRMLLGETNTVLFEKKSIHRRRSLLHSDHVTSPTLPPLYLVRPARAGRSCLWNQSFKGSQIHTSQTLVPSPRRQVSVNITAVSLIYRHDGRGVSTSENEWRMEDEEYSWCSWVRVGSKPGSEAHSREITLNKYNLYQINVISYVFFFFVSVFFNWSFINFKYSFWVLFTCKTPIILFRIKRFCILLNTKIFLPLVTWGKRSSSNVGSSNVKVILCALLYGELMTYELHSALSKKRHSCLWTLNSAFQKSPDLHTWARSSFQ